MMTYIEFEGLLVNQLTTKKIATSSIKFTDLISISKFTAREPKDYDPFNPFKDVGQIFEDLNDSYFQRLTNDDRVKSLYNYLLEEINNYKLKENSLGTFPTSIILSLDINEEFDTLEDYKKYGDSIKKDEKLGAFYLIENNKISFTVAKQKTSLIVDGQHRLAGIWKLYNDACQETIRIGRDSLTVKYPNLSYDIVKKALENFQLNCTILIGFDIWEQGKVFADVNFNQKPVNKSLYYDIFGSVPSQNKNDIFLAHMLAMYLNNNDKSVIKGFIKMLGTGEGFFSQAFFVEAILHHFKTKGIWSDMPIDYIDGGNKYTILPKFLINYFKAIRFVFQEYWPQSDQKNGRIYKNILVKTTGMGALLKLINPIYKDLESDNNFFEISEADLFQKFVKILEKAKHNEKRYFSGEGDFAGAGSLGLQNKLYKEIGVDLGYFNK